jgi:hypothetical protein
MSNLVEQRLVDPQSYTSRLPLQPDTLKPTVFKLDDSSKEFSQLLAAAAFELIDFLRAPYEATDEELKELATHYQRYFSQLPNRLETTPEELRNFVAEKAILLLPNEAELIMALLAEYEFIFVDTINFARAIINETALLADPIEGQRLLYYASSKELFLYVRPEAHRLLRRARMLGLIPFEVLDKLEKLPIKVIGASVAAFTIDLLASCGAQNIEWTDAGYLANTNGGRLPGAMGNIGNLGRSKAQVLLKMLYEKEPYANFTANHGVIQAKATGAEGELTLEEYSKDAGLLIEVVDKGALKILFRLIIDQQQIDVPLVWIADIAPDPIAGIEGTQFFNQAATPQQWQERLTSIMTAPDMSQKRAGLLLAVTEMLQNELSAEHTMSLLMTAVGAQDFWSQTPIDSRASAALTVGLVLQFLEGKDVVGKNYTHGQLNSDQITDLEEQEALLAKRQLAMKIVQSVLQRNLQSTT